MSKGRKPAYLKNAPGGNTGRSSVTQVTDANFEKEVIQSDLPVLVDFWAPWCGPCKMVGPVVEDLAREYDGRVKVVKMNTEENRMVPGQMGIRSIPTLIVFKGKNVVEHRVGAAPRKDLAGMLDRAIAEKKPGLMSRLFN